MSALNLQIKRISFVTQKHCAPLLSSGARLRDPNSAGLLVIREANLEGYCQPFPVSGLVLGSIGFFRGSLKTDGCQEHDLTINNYVKQPNQLIEIHTCHGVKEVKFCST
jgi:hypothetical protein